MSLTSFAVKRPVAMTMIVLMFMVLGLYSYRMIGVDLYPNVNIPYITVRVAYPGAGAEEVETQILKPVESAVSSISKLKSTISQASEGMGLVILEFELSANADQAAIDVQKKVDAIKDRLPEDAEDPVVVKMDMNSAPVINLAVKGSRSLEETYQLADDIVKERLLKVSGVTDATLVGGKERQIQIDIDKSRLEGYGLSINTVVRRLENENLNQPSGRLDRPDREYNIRVMGEFKSVKEIEDIQIPLSDGKSISLKNIATIRDDYKEMRTFSRLNGEPSIAVAVFKQSDASIVDIGDAVKAALPAIQKELPPDVEVIISQDFSDYVHKSLNGTRSSILEGIISTALCLFIFLRDWRSMTTVIIAIPTSLIATLTGMYFADFSFNMMSLMGMALCIGILVDDSIVVLENIHRHRAMGKSALDAVLEGRSEIGMAAIAITLSDVVIFAPIAFMGGMIGQFFRQFGLTVVIATLFSLFISFTLTPMLSHRFYMEKDPETGRLKAKKREASLAGLLMKKLSPYTSRFWAFTEMIGDRASSSYLKSLDWSLNHRKTVLTAAVAGFIASLMLIPLGLVGFEFMPKSDQGSISVSLEMPNGTPVAVTDTAVREIEAYIKTIPEVKYFQSSVGSSGGMGATAGSNKATIGVQLYSKTERSRSMWEIGDQLRNYGKTFKQGQIRVIESESGGGPGGTAIQLEVSGPDNNRLQALAEQVKTIAASTPGAIEVDTNFRLGQPEIQVTVDRQRAATYGISVDDISRTLRASITGDTATSYRAGDDDVNILVRLQGVSKTSMEELKQITVATASGMQVPLGLITEMKNGSGPTEIRRIDRQRTITVSGNIRKEIPQSQFNADLTQRLAQLQLPPGYSIKQAGTSEDMQETGVQLISAFLLSITLVYIVLAVLYESYLTPMIRMMSLPLGIIGGLIALAITGKTINLFSGIGIIMMDGLVAKNGTLLIDYTNTLMERGGKTLRECLVEAGKTRLRPIMMTTFTMIFGMLPVAAALTEGTEIRSGMAVVIIGGLITSTIFTLVVIPVFYTLIDDFIQWRKRSKLERLKKQVATIEAKQAALR
ncbi:efflux RND transporter permease subunit [Heliophilum fasciatum]|uniref:HAE1 family hydrophobic/amphiphilic exporter-1 n=1 Tax=Heliophilum fasciatum TaxID=35700 RepID=A0A4V2SVV4_9FIRM|nr:efflux RND transporter permease subunit [Heliophilum fasciatum]MCW2279419.1 HAE1 family hydrophobic/amphiphilic exporter-1 [Heliophilum fasciatum]TCP59976.1 HAE1 family hydrophobic/amphiphilic exporter-1 [Heliophilum fasciatum]